MSRVSAMIGRGEHALLVVGVVPCAECLALATRRRDAVQRRSGTGSEDGRKLPASCRAAQQTLLTLEPRLLRHDIRVVDELMVEVLQAVHLLQIKRIVRRVCTGGLDVGAGAQRL